MNRLIEQTIRILGFCLFLAGIGVFTATLLWQIYIYLKQGWWAPVTIFDLAYAASTRIGDEIYPSNWVGLREVMSLPNGGVLVLLCFSGLGLAMMNIEEI